MKNCFTFLLIVLMSLLTIAINGCGEQMTNQMDHIVNTGVDDDAGADDVVYEDTTVDVAVTEEPVTEEPVTEEPAAMDGGDGDTTDDVMAAVAALPLGTAVFVEPRQVTSPAVGQQLRVRINVKGAADVLAYEVTVGFDPTALRYVNITNADYLPAGAFASPPQTTANSVYMAATSVAGAAAAASGTLATVTFEVVSAKASTITLSNVLLSDSNVTPLALKAVDGKVNAR